ncbi:hypothetical protein CHS0354_041208 [Potamilus streckersoni]|uniref:Uncharacterized protein n=1 Tax=Potamilus streckersoni TaxID=2493646 RepID=A0AAE0SDM3_9BIVA|nr:hypothetical protein CHS0354_041208 [Potamilus streckersoni]
MDVEADSECLNGTFWWNYPRGYIRIHFKHKTATYLSVCLKDSAGGSSFKLYDVTSGNKIAMPSVTPDSSKEVCTIVHHYETVILFEAPKMAYYVRLIAYRVQPIYHI